MMTPYAVSAPQWIKIYDLWNDRPRIEAIQRASLQTADAGLVSEHGLFGSEEWWQAVHDGHIAKQVVEGYISWVPSTGPSAALQFDLVSASGTARWAWQGDPRYCIHGSRIKVVHAAQRLRTASDGMTHTNVVLEVFAMPPPAYAYLPAYRVPAGEYPSVGHGAIMCLILIGAQLVAGLIAGVILLAVMGGGDMQAVLNPWFLGGGNILAFGAAVYFCLMIGKKSLKQVVTFSGFRPLIIVALVPAVAGMSVVLSELDNFLRWLIPLTGPSQDLFFGAVRNHPIGFFFVLSVVAPITEEVFFRGLMLRGFLKRYSEFKSILISSILFALIHLNPYQIIAAFFIGLFLGWLFSRTGSLMLCILVHALHNGIVWLMMLIRLEIPGYSTDPSSLHFQPWWFNVAGLCCVAIGMAGLMAMLRRSGRASDDSDAGPGRISSHDLRP